MVGEESRERRGGGLPFQGIPFGMIWFKHMTRHSRLDVLYHMFHVEQCGHVVHVIMYFEHIILGKNKARLSLLE